METEPLYRKLQQHLDRMPIGFPATESGVEIRILRQLFTPEEAALTLEASAIPEPAATIHCRVKPAVPLADVKARLDQMAEKGIILRLPAPRGPLYAKMIFAVGFYERQLKNLTPELERDCREYLLGDYRHAALRKKTTQMRTVPVNKTIAIERNVATYEDIRGYIAAHPGPFAAMDCICRHGQELLGGKCKQTKLKETCLTVGVAAREMAQRGMGRKIERDEMLGLLDAADREGLVIQPENTQKPLFVCCCCGCCCAVLGSAKQFPRPAEYFSASFRAVVDPERCDACGVCQTRCQMDALVDAEGSGKPRVDDGRCIGCGLCVTTCPTEALRLVERDVRKVPPDDTKALYIKLLEERYGKWGLAKVGARRLLGMKF